MPLLGVRHPNGARPVRRSVSGDAHHSDAKVTAAATAEIPNCRGDDHHQRRRVNAARATTTIGRHRRRRHRGHHGARTPRASETTGSARSSPPGKANDESAAFTGDPRALGLCRVLRGRVSPAPVPGSASISDARWPAMPGSTPRFSKMRTSSRRSPSGRVRELVALESQFPVEELGRGPHGDEFSPAAMEKAPATRPATPAKRTTPPAGWAPAMPKINETLVTRPSLTPKTAARALPPWTWCGDGGRDASHPADAAAHERRRTSSGRTADVSRCGRGRLPRRPREQA